MFRSPAPSELPELPTWPQLLAEFGSPAAALARPRPGWLRLAGRSGSDGHLCQLDLNYHQLRTMVVRVSTYQAPPPEVRVRFTPEPTVLLRDFLANTDPDGPLTPPGEPVPGAGWLFVDGTAVEGRRLTHGDHVLTLALVGCTTVAVASTTELHDEAVHLTLDAPPLPA